MGKLYHSYIAMSYIIADFFTAPGAIGGFIRVDANPPRFILICIDSSSSELTPSAEQIVDHFVRLLTVALFESAGRTE